MVVAWRSVRSHQDSVANNQASVNDLIAPFRRHMCLSRRARVGHHSFDFAAETLSIELERLRALAAKIKIWIQLHSFLLGLIGDWFGLGQSPAADGFHPVRLLNGTR